MGGLGGTYHLHRDTGNPGRIKCFKCRMILAVVKVIYAIAYMKKPEKIQEFKGI